MDQLKERLQERLDQIPALLAQIASLPTGNLTASPDGTLANPQGQTISSSDLHTIISALDDWKEQTSRILTEECPDYNPTIDTFHRRWRIPILGTNLRASLTRRLRNARTDLRLILQDAEECTHPKPRPVPEEDLPTEVITDYARRLYNI